MTFVVLLSLLVDTVCGRVGGHLGVLLPLPRPPGKVGVNEELNEEHRECDVDEEGQVQVADALLATERETCLFERAVRRTTYYYITICEFFIVF